MLTLYRLCLLFAFQALLAAASFAGTVHAFETWTLPQAVSVFATFQSHNTKVLEAGDEHVIVAYQARASADEINRYVLSRLDFADRRETVLLEGDATTNAPCLARGPGEEFAVFINDYRASRVHFRRFAGETATQPVAASAVSSGMFGKYACAYLSPDYLVIGNDGVLITVSPEGWVKHRLRIFERGNDEGVSLQYPQLLSEDGALVLAFTTAKQTPRAKQRLVYWSIMVLRSPDGGATWFDLAGKPRGLPLPLEHDLTLAITPPNPGDENYWLSALDLVDDTLIANYSANFNNRKRNPAGGVWPIVTRWPLRSATGARLAMARLPAQWRDQRQSGFFVEDRRHPGHVYLVTFEKQTIVVLKSVDKGLSWTLIGRLEGGYTCTYALDGTREVTASREIIGVFTERGEGCGTKNLNGARLVAFRLRVGE